MIQQQLNELLTGFSKRESGEKIDSLAERLGDLCFSYDAGLTNSELQHVFVIIRALLRDTEMHVRRKLAEHLSVRDDVPHDLVVTLAQDQIEVAYPMIVWSKLLGDADLLEIVANHERQHQTAITERSTISAVVSDALVATDDTEVIAALLHNAGAEFSPETFKKLISECMCVHEYREPIVRREDLTPELAGQIYVWVGDALRDFLNQRYTFDPTDLENQIARALSAAMEEDEKKGDDSTDGIRFMTHSRVQRAADLLMDFLRDGKLDRFELDFVQMTGLSAGVVALALHNTGYAGVAILCKGVGVDRSVFSETFFHMHGGRSNALFRTTPEYKRAISYFDNLKRERARRVLKSWQDSMGPDNVDEATRLIDENLKRFVGDHK